MSKVKIQPNASGTGIFSIAAPATNTDRTLTLPDTSSTVFTEAGGTINGKFNIDGTQAIGPSSAANLSEATTLYAQKLAPLRTGSNYGLYIGNNGLNAAYFQVAATDATSAGILNLNPFGGYIITPSQPVFCATKSGSTFSGSGVYPADIARTNKGNCYNTSNYRFTAPVTGSYQFSFYTNFTGTANTDLYFNFYVNGANPTWGRTYTRYISGWELCSSTVILSLSVNDYVQVMIESSGFQADAGAYGAFSGHLIG